MNDLKILSKQDYGTELSRVQGEYEKRAERDRREREDFEWEAEEQRALTEGLRELSDRCAE